MRLMHNNRGFIATAVLYSMAIIIVLILFLILKNFMMMRQIVLGDSNSAKDSFLEYQVVYDPNGGAGTQIENSTLVYGKSSNLKACTYEKIGYDCVGWALTPTGSILAEPVKNLTQPNKKITVYAYYSAQAYLLTLNPNGGTVSKDTVEVVYDGEYNLPTPTRDGYIFNGWFYNENGVDIQLKTGDIVKITEDKTLVAHWTATTYTVTFDANGGSVSTTSKNVTYDSTYGDLPTPTRASYNFDGWFTAPTAGTLITKDSTVKITGATTLYAHWTKVTHTVTYNYSYNGGISATTTTATVGEGEAISLSPTASKSGWTFVGWNTNYNATTKLNSLNMGTSNVTLYAIYSKTLTITLKDYNGSSRRTRYLYPVMYNNATTASATLSSLGSTSNSCGSYSKLGWSTSSSATATVNYSAGSKYSFSSNTTLYARYSQEVTFIIDYNAGSTNARNSDKTRHLSGSGSKSNNGPYTYTFNDNCRRSGYTFSGWQGKYWKGDSVSWSCDTMYSAYWR